MRATVMYGSGDVRVDNVPDASLRESTDALVRGHQGGGLRERGRRPAPVRAYIEELLPDVLEGRIEPGRVFDRTGSLEDVPEGYRAMNDRDVPKFQIKP